ncbi:UNVERIFIED_ORG: hypothetical protein GGI63_006247 [Rhizobium esperanzae]|uniref:hypothetical protein n=1 Tax=Rhizobium phaseoli TaxID=396 RepID=UPI000202BE37|nr:hypothetical protein [Rhizobium phaseoli]EGE56463.1 hypothetical protein RHECNPAF_6760010 [Rhizobium etli CNPAF512]PDS28259.1 hypothetical protein CO650_27275 [Rhizobium phaseoli]
MASPWKLLARLISPGREQRRESGSPDKVTPGALPISGPNETAGDESLIGGDRPATLELPPHGKAGAIAGEPVQSEEAVNGGRVEVERGAAKIVETTDPTLSGGTGIAVTAAQNKIKRAVEVPPRKQRRRGKEAVAVANFSQVNDTTDEMNLDEEIKVLRDQLARKLKLQNAQLRKMLERFER